MEATALNERVRRLMQYHRTAAGYSMQKMAQLLYMPQADYRRIEGGATKDIDLNLVDEFCKVLKMPIYRFLLEGRNTTRDYATLITDQWSLLCQLRQYQQQLDELIGNLKQE